MALRILRQNDAYNAMPGNEPNTLARSATAHRAYLAKQYQNLSKIPCVLLTRSLRLTSATTILSILIYYYYYFSS
jgi:hypothetical protein